MDKKLKNAIDKIVRLSRENIEFGAELRRRLGADSVTDSGVSDDVRVIREALGIRANNSISYDFIQGEKNQRLRDQLVIDNLRMENAALNLQIEDENERFYVFCVNAFYQIENLVNYYFYSLYPEINSLLDVIEKATAGDKNEKTKKDYCFQRTKGKKEYKTVGDIDIVYKLNAVCNILFPGDSVKITYSQLRKVRNEGAHRCMVIMAEHDESNALYTFFKYNTFNSIRIALIKMVNAIKEVVK